MSKYRRKTEDEFEIQALYPKGWEVECTEATRKEARANLKLYRINAPGRSYRIVHHRVKMEVQRG